MDKATIRKELRAARRRHVEALPESMRSLVFHRPPGPLLEMVDQGASIGLYRAGLHEAPAASYAKFFLENGHRIALPRFESRNSPMEFAEHSDPFEESDCEVGPFGLMQPVAEASGITPDILFVPLIGFTEGGERIGQGGGHYDRWLAEHPATFAIGMGWDVQKQDTLPIEGHDRRMNAIVTPTRLYGPF